MHRGPSRPLPSTVVDRRGALGLAVAGAVGVALLASGCDLDDLTGSSGSSSDGPGAADARAAAADPDTALLDQVRVALDARLAEVVATRAARPRLRRALRPLELMHRAHLDALTLPTPTTPAGDPAPPPAPAASLDAVRTAEASHQTALADAAVTARSGALALLLASMSASVAQHLAVLPAPAGATP